MDCSPPGSSLHGILQARILEWVAIPFFRESSQPRDWTWVSCIAGRFFTIWTIKEAPITKGTINYQQPQIPKVLFLFPFYRGNWSPKHLSNLTKVTQLLNFKRQLFRCIHSVFDINLYCCCCLVVKLCLTLLQPHRLFSSVQSLSYVRLFATPWIAARQSSLSITNSRSLLTLMSIELVMPSSHLILCPVFFWPWYFPGKNAKVVCHFLLQGIFPTQRLNPYLLHWQVVSLPVSYQGSPTLYWICQNKTFEMSWVTWSRGHQHKRTWAKC